MKGIAKWIITATAVIAVGVMIALLLPKKGKVEKVLPPLVEVTKVETHDISASVDLVGYVIPTRQTAAIARSYGKVKNIHVNEGERVGKDQTLITLQPDEVGLEFQPQPVKAPISGVVAKIMIKEGEPAAPGTPLVAIVDPSNVEVELALPGEDYTSLKVGMRAFLYSNSDTITARVKSKSGVVDPMTRTFNVTLSPLGSSTELLPGLSVNAKLVMARRENVLVVPRSALDDSTLMVVSGDSVEYRKVRPGIAGDGFVEIISGIAEGELVVTFGGQTLKAGQKVRITER